MEDSPINKTYRLTLDFTVWMNDEILHPYSDEDELDEEEKRQLQAQRSLLQALLHDKRGILEELIRKRVLEDADGAVGIYELRERLLLRNLEDEDLLEPIIERLPRDDRLYLLEAIENSTFKDAAGEAIYSIGVELENALLTEVDKADEDEGFSID
jgi:hypothetical protein